MDKPQSEADVSQFEPFSPKDLASAPENSQRKDGVKLRGRVLESVFADPIYRQVLASVVEKEWGSDRMNRERTAASSEETNKDKSDAEQDSDPNSHSAYQVS
jgi:hypothetical protein